jgi:hypothetical protein
LQAAKTTCSAKFAAALIKRFGVPDFGTSLEGWH